ncbi:hypothetical protein HNV08_02440 [Winogradskyella eckloniae]|uniref:hypothetical protein n=1 Tax=Winogradskyella eckloniae TaxID=1089306 RepID=UPI001565707C|nr:hypothetical protein [Winogradskyella eckloniae]NRD18893.1 hypothetical protein [Winogradskyella eckloniae]
MATLLSLFSHTAFGQTKNEKEIRIKLTAFPKIAQDVIKSLPTNCKRLKYFLETDSTKRSFELKFKYYKKHYSLEFTEDGQIEDIEVLSTRHNINSIAKQNIDMYLSNTFLKYKFIKIQKQYVFSIDEDPIAFVNNILNNETQLSPNFEIIINVKTNKKRETREFLFSNSGEFLNQRTLSQSSYEHVLY